MKVNVLLLSLAAAVSALPLLDERGCTGSVDSDGSVVKRCAIPWTKNYGEYDEKRGCTSSVEEDGTVVKRCAIPWTKNYGDLEEDGDSENVCGEDAALRPNGAKLDYIRRTRRHSLLITLLKLFKDVLLIWPCDCGDSVAEAKAMGCAYDDMAPAWLPPHCIDKELKREWDKSGDGPDGRWQYWADSNHTQEMTVEEVSLLADTPGKYFYTTPRWHIMHCSFYWRKEHRSKSTGVTIEGRYDSERHVKHCGHMFQNPPDHLTYSYVTLKSSSPDPPDFELRRLKAAGIDPFEFDTRSVMP
ncbi:calcineurin-like phosphoesterase [Purpureocillium lavendulum]|uniref:Calcineurin-like phosphoesterase n=1 Tax=Purpureocillium lavendulum TaxID=1247861 RepID=A0AB34FEV4_9HYPO|nr:calcineurin-like phosphoesterase [Purpureocillium lavendulum]